MGVWGGVGVGVLEKVFLGWRIINFIDVVVGILCFWEYGCTGTCVLRCFFGERR